MENNEKNQDENLMGELKDIISRIHAFNRLHPDGIFIYSFVGFKENPDEVCEECGEHGTMEYDENKSIGGAFGHIDDIRDLCNEIRDFAEDSKDEDGFVNF